MKSCKTWCLYLTDEQCNYASFHYNLFFIYILPAMAKLPLLSMIYSISIIILNRWYYIFINKPQWAYHTHTHAYVNRIWQNNSGIEWECVIQLYLYRKWSRVIKEDGTVQNMVLGAKIDDRKVSRMKEKSELPVIGRYVSIKNHNEAGPHKHTQTTTQIVDSSISITERWRRKQNLIMIC